MPKKPLRIRIAEMIGKVETDSFINSIQYGLTTIFAKKDMGVNYAKNDYDLFRAIYFASRINGKGQEYLLAAALGKPIVNITTGFVVGTGFKVELDNPNADTTITEAEDKINDWLEQNMAEFYDAIKFHFRDGDGFVYLDELGNPDILDAATVTVQLDPISSKVIGFDVREEADLLDPRTGTKVTWIYLRQYRTNSMRILRWRSNSSQDKAEPVFVQVFREEPGNELSNPVDRLLPIVHFVNDKEPRQVYGNSEYQNLLTIFKNYSGVLENSTKGVIYNGTPIPVLKGVSNPGTLAMDSKDPTDKTADAGSKQEWGQDTILYLTGDNADAKFLQVTGIMDDASKLLEIYFFLFVQGSETPEFAFGTAVSSSKASTETQLPIFVKKVERKQRRLTGTIQDMVKLYIERNALISDPTFLKLKKLDPKIRVNFPSVAEDDKQLRLETVQWAVENSIMTSETALQLIAGDYVKDVKEEIRNAAKEADTLAKKNSKFDANRMLAELVAQNNNSNPTNNRQGNIEPA